MLPGKVSERHRENMSIWFSLACFFWFLIKILGHNFCFLLLFAFFFFDNRELTRIGRKNIKEGFFYIRLFLLFVFFPDIMALMLLMLFQPSLIRAAHKFCYLESGRPFPQSAKFPKLCKAKSLIGYVLFWNKCMVSLCCCQIIRKYYIWLNLTLMVLSWFLKFD